ncbi:hypothetical protein GIB67_016216 [Kingdonia uniflora]|uniref:Uncharacterized protein n=1 Tax=Kingdonia uniflora TaxID=39325 RepID=A0A7J7LT59_9MAGN|nr:hypothetical protein GIB67_016216 [Kingdonia uniflora]
MEKLHCVRASFPFYEAWLLHKVSPNGFNLYIPTTHIRDDEATENNGDSLDRPTGRKKEKEIRRRKGKDTEVALNFLKFCQVEVDENLTDANDWWVKIICERKQGQLSNFAYTMGDLGGNSHFSVGANVFGVSAESIQCSFNSKGNSVPTILLLMPERLYSQGGLKAEGVFWINPKNNKEEHVRDQLNREIVPDDININCLIVLIKAWF